MAKAELCNGQRIEWAYAYDQDGRLATVTRNSVIVEGYTYDAQGRRATERNLLRGIEARPYVYSAAGGHLDSAGPLQFRHDIHARCNRIWRRGDPTDYAYARDGSLRQVSRPDGVLVQYEYDQNGNRVATLVNGRRVRQYLWQDRLRLGAMYDQDADVMLRFFYADGAADGARLPWRMDDGSNGFCLFYDQVGSLRAIANDAGKVIQEIEYDTFGAILRETENGYAVPFGFAGGVHDRDTGLVLLGVRDYLPEVGRFMVKDPLGRGGGDPDLYGYCLDDPINRVDPSGMKSDCEEVRRNFDQLTDKCYKELDDDACIELNKEGYEKWNDCNKNAAGEAADVLKEYYKERIKKYSRQK